MSLTCLHCACWCLLLFIGPSVQNSFDMTASFIQGMSDEVMFNGGLCVCVCACMHADCSPVYASATCATAGMCNRCLCSTVYRTSVTHCDCKIPVPNTSFYKQPLVCSHSGFYFPFSSLEGYILMVLLLTTTPGERKAPQQKPWLQLHFESRPCCYCLTTASAGHTMLYDEPKSVSFHVGRGAWVLGAICTHIVLSTCGSY